MGVVRTCRQQPQQGDPSHNPCRPCLPVRLALGLSPNLTQSARACQAQRDASAQLGVQVGAPDMPGSCQQMPASLTATRGTAEPVTNDGALSADSLALWPAPRSTRSIPSREDARVGHGEDAGAGKSETRVELVGKLLAVNGGPAPAGAGRVAALDHKVLCGCADRRKGRSAERKHRYARASREEARASPVLLLARMPPAWRAGLLEGRQLELCPSSHLLARRWSDGDLTRPDVAERKRALQRLEVVRTEMIRWKTVPL